MSSTAIKLERAEEDALNKMVKKGLFANKDEAARAGLQLSNTLQTLESLAHPAVMWNKISRHKRRKGTSEQFKKDF